MKRYIALLLIVSLVLMNGCKDSNAYVELSDERIDVEIAKTSQERTKGLMFREELCDNCGMLFIFEEEDFHGFWMKNTLIPLDIIFINSDLEVVDVFHAVPCVDGTCEDYIPKEKALYVLETNVDKFDESVVGEKIVMFRNQKFY